MSRGASGMGTSNNAAEFLCEDLVEITQDVVEITQDDVDALEDSTGPRPSTVAEFLEEDVAEITHDLKSPLSVIALEVALLGDKLGDESPLEARLALRRISRNVAFMDRIIHDLLDMSSLINERLEIVRE